MTPQTITGLLVDFADLIISCLTDAIIIVYVTILSPYVGLLVIASILIGSIIEFARIKVMNKKYKQSANANDKIHSITTEIIKSEKDIKSLGLESKLSEVSKQAYDKYKNIQQNT